MKTNTQRKENEYEIVAIQDMVEIVTPENKERFKADINNLIDEIAKAKSEHPDMYVLADSYIWVDDGKQNRKITKTFIL